MINRSKYSAAIRENTRIIVASVLTVIFLIISVLSVRAGGTFLWLIPPALLLVLVAVLAIDKFLLVIIFLVPLSVQLRFIMPETPADIFLPTEIMLAGILILMIYKLLINREVDRKILVHPVTIVSLCILGWCLVSSLTSTIPAASVKSLIAKLWFVAAFYLLATAIFRKPEKIRSYFYAYLTGMTPVILYYLFRMWQAGIFNQEFAHTAIRPFFNDHTSFGAALAFCIPVILYFLGQKNTSKKTKAGLFLLLCLFAVAFIFSYSRAAWLSLFFSVLVSLLLLLRVTWKIILPATIVSIFFVVLSWSDIMMRLSENRQESSGNLASQLQSIYNIRSDASNMERMNRWKSALRMFSEKPLMGWGPATYQFNYGPFQMASEKTIISTNFGEKGNAHSEYLGSLSEEGLPGLLLYLCLLFITIRKGIVIWKTHKDRQIKYLALAMVAGLVTYVVHGALNNFLDTDKISALFWGMIAAIVSMDIKLKKEKDSGKLSQISSDD